VDVPWLLAQRWKDSELVLIDDTGHTGGPAMNAALVAATDRCADPGVSRG
jgi:proline iminopeptidase